MTNLKFLLTQFFAVSLALVHAGKFNPSPEATVEEMTKPEEDPAPAATSQKRPNGAWTDRKEKGTVSDADKNAYYNDYIDAYYNAKKRELTPEQLAKKAEQKKTLAARRAMKADEKLVKDGQMTQEDFDVKHKDIIAKDAEMKAKKAAYKAKKDTARALTGGNNYLVAKNSERPQLSDEERKKFAEERQLKQEAHAKERREKAEKKKQEHEAKKLERELKRAEQKATIEREDKEMIEDRVKLEKNQITKEVFEKTHSAALKRELTAKWRAEAKIRNEANKNKELQLENI